MKFSVKIYYVDDSWDEFETENLAEIEKKIEDGPGVTVISNISVELVRESPKTRFGSRSWDSGDI